MQAKSVGRNSFFWGNDLYSWMMNFPFRISGWIYICILSLYFTGLIARVLFLLESCMCGHELIMSVDHVFWYIRTLYSPLSTLDYVLCILDLVGNRYTRYFALWTASSTPIGILYVLPITFCYDCNSCGFLRHVGEATVYINGCFYWLL